MLWRKILRASVCLVLSNCTASVDLALAQVRVFEYYENAPEDAQRDYTHELPWNDIQTGKINAVDVPNPCANLQSEIPAANGSTVSPSDGSAKLVGATSAASSCVFRDLVLIEFINNLNYSTRCTGVLVGDNLVLTAAHCSCGKLDSYRIYFHKNIIPSKNERLSDEVNANIKHVLQRPPDLFDGYDCTLSPQYQAGRDLAILAIEQYADFNIRLKTSLVKPDNEGIYSGFNAASTAQIYVDDPRTSVLVGAGYGETEGGSLPETLQFASIPIRSFFCAQGQVATSTCRAFREFVLADLPDTFNDRTSDSCGGDSGAPIFYKPSQIENSSNNSEAIESQAIALVGITSRALGGVKHRTSSLCGGGGIYTSVGHPDVLDWLRSFGIKIFGILENSENNIQ